MWSGLKYENIYLNDCEAVHELRRGVAWYFTFYSSRRFHQTLGYQTPDKVYFQTFVAGGITDERQRNHEGERHLKADAKSVLIIRAG
ncbi:MAG: hypothetical protein ACNI3A_02375 [Desulfovibrio sp.]|uniref:hypothetical protein n=1 Tax=Desulfovibrio sp. 7SRBS1 TaxID=3378064 RepID=UPI003B3E8A32